MTSPGVVHYPRDTDILPGSLSGRRTPPARAGTGGAGDRFRGVRIKHHEETTNNAILPLRCVTCGNKKAVPKRTTERLEVSQLTKRSYHARRRFFRGDGKNHRNALTVVWVAREHDRDVVVPPPNGLVSPRTAMIALLPHGDNTHGSRRREG